ncbi:unnamed protein product [Tuwongella immobilis]|uniref:Uncharacterized protein n=1 Tax=Tuwongella immobilis TaxID=692036 RepID=A0A6C2YUT3_9BACT|nr:unnamed protein product [Tuwongella immobilis]VTS07590.1 unnamed protein product [Tuwongella immobilis]
MRTDWIVAIDDDRSKRFAWMDNPLTRESTTGH